MKYKADQFTIQFADVRHPNIIIEASYCNLEDDNQKEYQFFDINHNIILRIPFHQILYIGRIPVVPKKR